MIAVRIVPSEPDAPLPYTVMHHGHPAFHYARIPAPEDTIATTDARLLDGTQPTPHTDIHCGTCGAPLLAPTQEQP